MEYGIYLLGGQDLMEWNGFGRLALTAGVPTGACMVCHLNVLYDRPVGGQASQI